MILNQHSVYCSALGRGPRPPCDLCTGMPGFFVVVGEPGSSSRCTVLRIRCVSVCVLFIAEAFSCALYSFLLKEVGCKNAGRIGDPGDFVPDSQTPRGGLLRRLSCALYSNSFLLKEVSCKNAGHIGYPYLPTSQPPPCAPLRHEAGQAAVSDRTGLSYQE